MARYNNFYYPGVINKAIKECLFIKLDTESELLKFDNVISCRKYDIVSDASPSLIQININTKVCFRCLDSLNPNQDKYINVFLVGKISQILQQPTRFLVEESSSKASYIVKRADLRLLKPPWWDELEGFDEYKISYLEKNGKFITNQIIK